MHEIQQANALDGSVNNVPKDFPLSTADFHFSTYQACLKENNAYRKTQTGTLARIQT